MTALSVGVMGHVDHGKTALVRALTGKDTDRLAEEKARGISIALGFALLRAGVAEIDLIDMPGHERFVRTMVAGASGIGAVLLVVSAVEGMRAQTREHLEIAGLLGLRRGVIAVSQCDRAEEAQALAAGAAASAFAAGCGLPDLPVILTSAVTGQGVAALAEGLSALADATPPPAPHGLFQLAVDRAFALPGAGVVVTGTLRRGRMAVGEEAELLPGGRPVRLRGLHVQGRAVPAAMPGRRVAAALRGVELGGVARGMVLATPGAAAAGEWLDVRLHLLASCPSPLADGATLRLLTGTAEVAARLRLPAGGAIAPGETILAQLRCADPVVVLPGDGFVLRQPSPARTVGGGSILDPLAARWRRRDASRLPRLSALAEARWRDAVDLLLREAAATPRSLVPRIGHAAAALRGWALARGARELPDGTLVHAATWAEAERALGQALAELHARQPMRPGVGPEALRPALPAGSPPALLGAVLAALVENGVVTRRGDGLLHATGFDPARAMAASERDLVERLDRFFRQAGLSPPAEAELLARHPDREPALRLLLSRGRLVRAIDRVQRRSILFHRDALEEAKRRLAVRFPSGQGFAAGEAGTLLGISRKFSIPLLEHLDAIRFTRRVGDRRYVERDPAGD